jgi:hypothetical protein
MSRKTGCSDPHIASAIVLEQKIKDIKQEAVTPRPWHLLKNELSEFFQG